MADQPVVVLSEAELNAILACVTDVESKLNFLQPVAKASKRKTQNMGNNAVSYVEKGIVNSRNYLGKLSREFDPDAYQTKYELLKQSAQIRSRLQAITSKLDSNIEGWGAELMVATNKVYKALQVAVKEDDSLKDAVEVMGEFYKRRNRKDKTIDPNPTKKAA